MSARQVLTIVMAGVVAASCGAAGQATTPERSAAARTPTSVAPEPTTQPATPTPSAGSSAAAAPSTSASIDPARFSATVDNPWFPLAPGTTFTYVGTKEDAHAIDTFSVTTDTVLIDGVPCVVVHDQLTLDGVLEEETLDYYSQDIDGNVWYFGEDTKELDAKGKVVSREGTWHAGVDGARPGIYMEADPTVGHSFEQEFYKGHAEDHFTVTDLATSVTVPFGSFNDGLLTEEWTPLEPDVLDHKVYVRGVGQVLEEAVKGPVEKTELTKVMRP